MAEPVWWIYLIRCRDGELYTGICTDVERRFAEHESGGPRAAKFLRGRAPLELAASSPVGSRSLALRLEAAVKRLDRAGKLALLGDGDRLRRMIDRIAGDRDDERESRRDAAPTLK